HRQAALDLRRFRALEPVGDLEALQLLGRQFGEAVLGALPGETGQQFLPRGVVRDLLGRRRARGPDAPVVDDHLTAARGEPGLAVLQAWLPAGLAAPVGADDAHECPSVVGIGPVSWPESGRANGTLVPKTW